MKFLMFAASLQQQSLNKKLIALAEKIIRESGNTVDHADFSEFELPLYNADIEKNQGFPTSLQNFVTRLAQADGLILSSPEYNFTTPGTLKNLIDWVSRMTPQPWRGRCILLLSASPSLVGGNRGLWNTRIPLECCGAMVYPSMFSLASAQDAFTDEGQLKDSKLQNRLAELIKNFCDFTRKIKSS